MGEKKKMEREGGQEKKERGKGGGGEIGRRRREEEEEEKGGEKGWGVLQHACTSSCPDVTREKALRCYSFLQLKL